MSVTAPATPRNFPLDVRFFVMPKLDVVAMVTPPPPEFEIVNLGGAETTALSDLVRWIAEELGVEARADFQPEQPGDVPITYADVSKAKRLLAYEPKVPIREGLKRFVAWYRAAGAP